MIRLEAAGWSPMPMDLTQDLLAHQNNHCSTRMTLGFYVHVKVANAIIDLCKILGTISFICEKCPPLIRTMSWYVWTGRQSSHEFQVKGAKFLTSIRHRCRKDAKACFS
ncbi:hypothetical protein IF1G_02495 [Cordyceps javanica]|uniref:Uncharacterized protein n=1 Tax=Cordyceps javanica TaxID=43265 RepID=A0A545V9K6_9HYPO|nr:hypothetical protein IF1G_02495 [Cordyceps javanica]